MNDEFMEEYTRIAEVFRTCCTDYGVEDRPSCDECPYSDLIIKSLASKLSIGEVMFCDYTECKTALCTRVYEMMDELILALGHARQIEKRSNEIISELGDKVRNVVPVRHGTWIKADEQPYFRKHYHAKVCSECGKRKDGKWLYCPYCGSKNQDGGQDNG